MKRLLAVVALATTMTTACAAKHVAWTNDHTRLGRAVSLQCTWQQGASANWDSGTLRVSLGQWNTKQPAVVTFADIDRATGTATFTGPIGTFPVTVFASAGSLTFLERPPRGLVNITTVFAGHPDDDGDLLVAHSRHFTSTAGRPLPSQYYGTCFARGF